MLTGAAATIAAASSLPISSSPASAKASTSMADDVMKVVGNRFGVTIEEIVSASRAGQVVAARQHGMYIYRRLSGKSLPEIGRRFGNRDHTTVAYAINKIDDMMLVDEHTAKRMRALSLDCICEIEVSGHKPSERIPPAWGGIKEQGWTC